MNTSAITNTLNIWLEKNGFAARVVGTYSDFCWDIQNNLIYYSFAIGNTNLKLWDKLLVSLGCQYNIDPFFSIFLHELFHSITYPELLDEEIDESEDIKNQLMEKENFTKEDYWLYYNLPMEIVATQGAVNFINTHPNEVRDLISAVSPLIQDFYKLNKIA